MKRRLYVSPRADQDIDEQFAYIAQADLDAALRFYDAAFETFDSLLQMPLKGALRHFQNPRLPTLRLWFVQGFEKHLIFYQVQPEIIEIVRVLHASRDIEQLLGTD